MALILQKWPKTPSVNFEVKLWEFHPENFAAKSSRPSFVYLEQLWFNKLCSILNSLGGDSFLAQDIKTRQILGAKHFFEF